MTRALLLAAAVLAPLAVPLSALAQPTPNLQQLRDAQARAQAEREAAEAAGARARLLAQEERRLAERRVAIARRVQQAEQRLSEAEERARLSAIAADQARAQVSTRALSLAPLVPVMRRLSLWPAESLLAVPVPAEEAVRGLLVLQGFSHRLAQEVVALRLAEMQAESHASAAAAQARELATARAQAEQLGRQLDEALEEARQVRAAAAGEEVEAARRAQDAAGRMATLEAALARLEREAHTPPPPRPARPPVQDAARREPEPPAGPRGNRALPVAGTLQRDFGSAGEGGLYRGQSWSAPAGARVVSPCAGRAVFSGPFRSYGQLLIVDCGEGYHFVLAGFERLDVAAGHRVLAGEPVGVLPPASDSRSRAALYLELRHRGQAVDPRPWFAARG